MTATKPSKNGKPKQQHFKGMAPPSIPAIDRLADDFYEAKNEEKLAKQEVETKGDLLFAQMTTKRLKNYRTANGRWVEIHSTTKVKVTSAEADKPKVSVGDKGAGDE